MKLFAIHAPRTVEAVAGLEGARAARTGFSVAALIFGPLWLLFRGLWLALLAYVALAAVVVALARYGLIWPGAAAALAALGHIYLGFEGRALALAARARSGRPLIDLVFARSALEAEKIYLERALEAAPPAAAARRAAPGGGPDVIGLFPEPGR